MLNLNNVSVYRGENKVVSSISFNAEKGRWYMLLGANGAGKSSLISAVSGLIPYKGSIRLLDKEIKVYKPKSRAKIMGVLEQQNFTSFDYKVEELVRLGRYAHNKGFLSQISNKTDEFVESALEIVGLKALRNKSISQISGGERQRAFLAQVFAQNPSVLLLDEPITSLDLASQKYIMDVIDDWRKAENRLVISAMHDILLALSYGTDALILKKGAALYMGDMLQLLNNDSLNLAYDMDVIAFLKKTLKTLEF